MAQEIRCLPDDHDAKLNVWEVRHAYQTAISYPRCTFVILTFIHILTWLQVGKMSLYAASSAIREIQKIVLDPKYLYYTFFIFKILPICLKR